MDVVFPADAAGVAEPFRGQVNGGDDVALRLLLCLRRPDCTQRFRGQHGAGPGAEILGRDLATGDLLEVRVDVFRIYFLAFAIVVQILEQLFARQLLTALNDSRDALVGYRDGVLDTALAL